MDKILEVKNLRISFRTNNGTVKAVRDINFTLNRGETLAIVGESGSGKSVTARAIMGIQAGNSIVESGEIFYDGKDLVKISEEDFQKLRGNRISMIFQDPFSSLNPIVRIGRQLTEAMILNGKANQREAKREFRKRIKELTQSVNKAKAAGGGASIEAQMSMLRNFSKKGSGLEKLYNAAHGNIMTTITNIDGALIDIIRGEPKVIAKEVNEIIRSAERSFNDFLIRRDEGELTGKLSELKEANVKYLETKDNVKVKELLGAVRDILNKAKNLPTPDFFSLGYYFVKNPQATLDVNDIVKLNKTTQGFTNDNFLNAFLEDLQKGIGLSHKNSMAKKLVVVEEINKKLPLFDNDNASVSQCVSAIKELIKIVEASIDRLAIQKDSLAYTFRSGSTAAVEKYVRSRGLKDKKRLSKKDEQFIATNDLDLCRSNVAIILTRIRDSYQNDIEQEGSVNIAEVARQTVSLLKAYSSRMVYRVTKRIAKSRAISLMEEVGIPEARARYRQYPFQFSGGMRQRVVIAIALAANPDILICDEPSTALDVTIQAQILDLIKGLKDKRQLSVIFITHDLGVVANIADKLAVMYAGKIVEEGSVDEVFFEPAHPYTWALLASMPDLDTTEKLEAIPGTPPNMITPPPGDAFAARNKYALAIDFEQEPPFFDITPTHKAATWLLHPDAPKAEPPRIVTERIERMRNMEVQDNG